LLLVSLAASAGPSAWGKFFRDCSAAILLAVLNTVVSFGHLHTTVHSDLHGDTAIPRPGLVLGAFVTAVLFKVGKSCIGIYLGRAAPSSPYAAGALIALTFWIYYSAQIFLFGAELTKPSLTSARPPTAKPPRNDTPKHEFVLNKTR
jgi:membrane protein